MWGARPRPSGSRCSSSASRVEAVAIVPLTGDRGLAGSFNAQILRRAFALERALEAEGKTVRWVAVGKKGRSTLTFRRRELSASYIGVHRSPRVRGRAGDRARGRRALHERRGRSRRPRLQHVRLRAHAARHRAGRAPDLARHPRDRRRRARRPTRSAATSSSSRNRRRSSSACSRSTSRRRSTARCSSRPRPSRARG